jgi:hypothetical protein
MKITIKNALTEQWPWALLVVLAGIVVGVLIGLKAPMSQAYLATSSVRLAKTVVTGVDMPCTAAALPSLAKSQKLLDDVNAAQALNGAPALVAERVGTAVAGADVMQPTYVGATAAGAIQQAQQLAIGLSNYCSAETVSRYTAYNRYLLEQRAARQNEIARLDAILIPANDKSVTRDQLKKQQDDLSAKITALQAQASAQAADVKTKQAQLKALLPAAKAFIEQSDALFTTNQAQLTKDRAALTEMRGLYKAAYPALKALEAKVGSEQKDFDAYRATLDAKSPLIDPAYRAAQARADEAQAALDGTNSQLAGTKEALADVTTRLNGVPTTVSQEVRNAGLAREKAELVKQYQALSGQYATALTEEALIPVTGPLAVVPAPAFAPRVGLLVAALFGLLTLLLFVVLAVLLAVVLNALDRRLLTVQSITKLYGKPVIATTRPKR